MVCSLYKRRKVRTGSIEFNTNISIYSSSRHIQIQCTLYLIHPVYYNKQVSWWFIQPGSAAVVFFSVRVLCFHRMLWIIIISPCSGCNISFWDTRRGRRLGIHTCTEHSQTHTVHSHTSTHTQINHIQTNLQHSFWAWQTRLQYSLEKSWASV